jgi:hypothetical protein
LATVLHVLVGRWLAGAGRLAVTAAATSMPGTPATRSGLPPPRSVGWTVPAGQARAGRLGLLPRASEMGRGSRGPIVFLGPAQRHLNKSVFISLFIILDEKHFGKCFLGHFSSKNGEINFYGLFGTRSMI